MIHFLIWKELAKRQASDNKVYEVLHKDNKAHVVKINDCPRAGETQYGYVIWDKSVRTPGPVRRVDKVNICNAPENISYGRLILSDTVTSVIVEICSYKLRREALRPTHYNAILLKKAIETVKMSCIVTQNTFNIEK